MKKQIKLDEFLRCCGENSADVQDDYDSDWMVAYCGDGLSPAGKEKYQHLLDLTVDWNPDEKYAVVRISHLKNADELSRQLKKLFFYNAGYCSEKLWEKLFI